MVFVALGYMNICVYDLLLNNYILNQLFDIDFIDINLFIIHFISLKFAREWGVKMITLRNRLILQKSDTVRW